MTFAPPYEPDYLLLKESRKSWENVISDVVVYSLDPLEVAFDSFVKVTKDYLVGDAWMEFHLTFEGQGHTHFAGILESNVRRNIFGKFEIYHGAVGGDSSMLVEIAHGIKSPKKVFPDSVPISSVVRLKRFDNENCICGYSGSVLQEPISSFMPLDRELSSFGVGSSNVGQRPDQLIQRRSQTIEQISNDQRDDIGSLLEFDENIEPLIFNILLSDKGVGLGFVENIKFMPKSIKVYFRPSSFEIGVSQTHAIS
jgi:hypothetical protein